MNFLLIRYEYYHWIFSVLEVYQFARDASVAEQWLMAQEPYLTSAELGVSKLIYFVKLTANIMYGDKMKEWANPHSSTVNNCTNCFSQIQNSSSLIIDT